LIPHIPISIPGGGDTTTSSRRDNAAARSYVTRRAGYAGQPLAVTSSRCNGDGNTNGKRR